MSVNDIHAGYSDGQRKKILIVCTTDSMIWNFLIPHIEGLLECGYAVECACSETGFFLEELQKK